MKKVLEKKYKWNGATKYTNQEEKYLIELRYLATTIPGFKFLSVHQQASAVNDSFLSFVKAVERKGMDTTHYNKYKGYLFITIKNTINRMNTSEKLTHKNKDNNFYIDEQSISDSEISDSDYTIQRLDLQTKIKNLPEKCQLVISYLSQGYRAEEISKILNINCGQYQYYRKKCYQILFPNFKKRLRQYADTTIKRTCNHNTKDRVDIDYKANDFYGD